MNRRQIINKILQDHIDVNKHEDYTNYKNLITAIENWHEREVKKLPIHNVSSSYVVFEDGADESLEGMTQLSVPFKTLEEAQTYASSWRSRKTYVAKMIE